MSDWQPIETAPETNEFNPVDLWLHFDVGDGTSWGFREPDCRWDPARKRWVDCDGGLVGRHREYRGGRWVDVDEGTVTHWMPIPKGPGE